MTSLSGKVALVTGGSRGIGAAISRRLAREGARIALTYARNTEAARAVVAEIEAEGGEVRSFQADMAHPDELERAFTTIGEHFGHLDILVNNAAISASRSIEATDAAFFEEMFGVNVRGPLLAIRKAITFFTPAGGRIVNISSSITRSPTAEWAIYAASKSALEMLTACLAMELGPRHISVNAVAPGITQTEMLHAVIPADIQRAMVANTALGRLGHPDDIADVVAFLCGPDSRWITGQTLIANGGLR